MKGHSEVFSIIPDKFWDQILNLIVTISFHFLHSNSHVTLPLGKVRCRWENNIKVVLKEMRCNSMGWSHLVRVRDLEGLCSCEHSLLNDHECDAR
jgi:hypothetical protein